MRAQRMRAPDSGMLGNRDVRPVAKTSRLARRPSQRRVRAARPAVAAAAGAGGRAGAGEPAAAAHARPPDAGAVVRRHDAHDLRPGRAARRNEVAGAGRRAPPRGGVGALIGGGGAFALLIPLVAGMLSARVFSPRWGRRLPFVAIGAPLLMAGLTLLPFMGGIRLAGFAVLLFFVGSYLYYPPYLALYADLLPRRLY